MSDRAGRSSRGDGLQFATELALAGVTAAAVLGMHRLFADGSFRLPVLFQVGVAHLAMAILRRRQVPLRAAIPLSVVLAVLSITWAQYIDTTWVLVPSPDTLSAVQGDIDSAWQLFQDVRAPAPVEPGFIVVTSLAVWLIAFIGDWGAFRTGVSFEALLPPATLYLFGAVLGAEGGRAPSAGLFVGAAMVFLLLHRTWRQEETAAWVASRHRQARRALVSTGTGLAFVAVAAGAAVGPQLPGADGDGVVPWRNLSEEDETRVVISPLVRIQSDLVEQSNVEVFTVQTDESDPVGSYWRLTALDDFDGQIWRSSYETDDAAGELPRSVESSAAVRTVTQTIDVRALAQIWLPAAYEPVSIDTGDSEVDYDPASSTLIVNRDVESSDGMRYTVTSEIPSWTAEELRSASPEVPDGVAERYLALPDDLSPRITDLARQVTAQGSTPYDKAILLQDYLREFEYSLEVQNGHGDRALEQFLFENQRGYCEQFAGSYAAMTRALDIPSRVVVGFTMGVEDPNQPGLYRVNGEHAHAWVELYFHGYGWVTFDPTPTRGPPGASSWLGIEEDQQDAADGSGTAATATPGEQPPPQGPSQGAPSRPDANARGDVQVGASEIESRDGDDDGVVPEGAEKAGIPVGIAVLAYVVLVPLAQVLQRALRRRRARAPAQQVGLAWQDVSEQFVAAGLRLSSSLTVAERAAKMRLAMPEVAADINLLAGTLEQAAYAERPPMPEEAEAVTAASSRVSVAVARRQPRYRRVLRYFDIRRLFTGRDRTRRSTHEVARSLETAVPVG